MAKLKSPLLSMGAEGTIADALTFQKRGQTTMVREKPIPAYRRTLPQVYQRWLYEDYAYLWTQQTAIIKRQCAATGSRFHLTGFQYWMKLMLSTLPDIAGMWHLDEKSGTLAKDFSRNGNNGTIYGATPVVGIIDYAQSFDGINDYINFGNKPSLEVPSNFTIELYLYFHGVAISYPAIVWKYKPIGYTFIFAAIDTTTSTYAQIWINGAQYVARKTAVSLNQWHLFHLQFYPSLHQFLIYADNIPGTMDATPPNLPCDTGTGNFILQWTSGTSYIIADHLIFYNRALDSTERLRHSKRRYPP